MMKVRKGFTLVELLIVIVIIGILAAAMMLSSGSATASAEASNIISDLRSLKAAALLFYADSMDDADLTDVVLNVTTHLSPYVDNPDKFNNGRYHFVRGTNDSRWYLNYTGIDAQVQEKLEGKAESVGLLAGDAIGTPYTANATVWMVAR